MFFLIILYVNTEPVYEYYMYLPIILFESAIRAIKINKQEICIWKVNSDHFNVIYYTCFTSL